MTEFALQSLHDQIEADPQAIGYKEPNGDWKGDQVIADLFNDSALGAVIERSNVSAEEIIQQITIVDWRALSTGDQLYCQLLMPLGNIDTTSATEVRAALLAIFAPGTDTRDNLIAVVERQGSPAEVVWGEGTRITAGNVGHSANL